MRLRKQKEVQKENEFYMQLLQQALPPEQQAANGVAVTPADKPKGNQRLLNSSHAKDANFALHDTLNP